MLRRLIREEIEPSASARRRLVSAVLLGGNVTVRAGSDRGGDFKLRGAFPFTPTPDATWGLHLADANIALGRLADLVRRQIHASD